MPKKSPISLLSHPYAPYIAPMVLFAVLTYISPLTGVPVQVTYPLKVVLVGAILVMLKDQYRTEIRMTLSVPAILAGILVFVIWVVPEGYLPVLGESHFNPYENATGLSVYVLIGFRMIGAVLIVPLMEELFWRSFAMRFLIDTDFKALPLGQFSWFSFLAVSVAFGFEHHRWVVGIVAGLVYAGLLCRSKNLFVPILSHGVTNLLLGIYVLVTKQWTFW